MKPSVNNQPDALSPICRQTQNLLSEYVDNALSAHHMWEVEKHLALCQNCNEVARQMQTTIHLLHAVERFDTGDDFMSKLHARLDGVEPEPMRRPTPISWLQDLVERIHIDLTTRRMPVLNFGIATAAMGLIVVVSLVGRPTSVPINSIVPTPQLESNQAIAHVDPNDLQRNLALTASDPLGDVAAENLRITDSGMNGTNNSNGSNSSNTSVSSQVPNMPGISDGG